MSLTGWVNLAADGAHVLLLDNLAVAFFCCLHLEPINVLKANWFQKLPLQGSIIHSRAYRTEIPYRWLAGVRTDRAGLILRLS